MPTRSKAAGKKGGNPPIPPHVRRALLGMTNTEAMLLIGEVLKARGHLSPNLYISEERVRPGADAVTNVRTDLEGNIRNPEETSSISIHPRVLDPQTEEARDIGSALPARYTTSPILPTSSGEPVSTGENVLIHEAAHYADTKEQYDRGEKLREDGHDKPFQRIAEEMGSAVIDPHVARVPKIRIRDRVTRGERKAREKSRWK